MYSFFVLGQVPGTNITITFTMWMQLFAAVLAIRLFFYVRHRQKTSNLIHPLLQSTISND